MIATQRRGDIFAVIVIVALLYVNASIACAADKLDVKISQLVELTGSTRSGMEATVKGVCNNFGTSLKKLNPDVPDEIIKKSELKYGELLTTLFLGEGGLHGQLLMVYKKYYNEKDIDKYLSFYRSKLWQNATRNKGKLTKSDVDEVKREFQKVIDSTGGKSKQDAIKEEMKAKTDQFVKDSIVKAQNDLNKYLKALGYRLNGDKIIRL